MFYQPLRKLHPIKRIILLCIAMLMLYYGGCQWIIQEELRWPNAYGSSGTLCLLPFVLSVATPQAPWIIEPSVPGWLGWGSLLGVIWIYIVEFRLYRTVNALYRRDKLQEPLKVW